ncbi:MAG: hypothetical protein PHS88_04120, partial [Candidatus Omnitrophica bacterium]|nr:hypothetical protein [Candidatus Omnitrophota bacterium]
MKPQKKKLFIEDLEKRRSASPLMINTMAVGESGAMGVGEKGKPGIDPGKTAKGGVSSPIPMNDTSTGWLEDGASCLRPAKPDTGLISMKYAIQKPDPIVVKYGPGPKPDPIVPINLKYAIHRPDPIVVKYGPGPKPDPIEPINLKYAIDRPKPDPIVVKYGPGPKPDPIEPINLKYAIDRPKPDPIVVKYGPGPKPD